MNFKLPHLSYQRTGQIADDFLAKYYPSLLLPVPIDEIGHLILHGDLFKQLGIMTVGDLNKFASRFSDEEYSWFEYQAYSFGSQVLVPKNLLFKEIQKKTGRI